LLHPSDRFLWVEGADGRGENQGSWSFVGGTPAANFSDAQFGDSPAAFHITSATFSFADGHSEAHKWLNGTTIAYANSTDPNKDGGSGGTQAAANISSKQDLQWLGQRYPTSVNP
jgi:prepilin-type processing-associated H-X9-DG protein